MLHEPPLSTTFWLKLLLLPLHSHSQPVSSTPKSPMINHRRWQTINKPLSYYNEIIINRYQPLLSNHCHRSSRWIKHYQPYLLFKQPSFTTVIHNHHNHHNHHSQPINHHIHSHISNTPMNSPLLPHVTPPVQLASLRSCIRSSGRCKKTWRPGGQHGGYDV